MRNFKMIAALLTGAVFPVAFDTGGKWKMDGDKLALDGDGNPIYVKADNTEQSVKGDTIANLNAEAKTHRTAKETAEKALDKYKLPDGKLVDPQTAIKAVDTVSKLDAKQLIDAGEVDKVRKEIGDQFSTQLAEKDAAINSANDTIAKLNVAKVFDGSEFVRERVAVPRDMFQSTFEKNFKFEDGKVVAYGRDGNKLLSKKAAGEYADADEALELLVEMHPQKDAIIKAQQGGGTGNGGGGGNRGGGRVIRRAEFDALTPTQQAETATAVGKGEMTISD
jgi:flavin-binding protein dodecin